jgi:DNA damage-inducible protein 1
MENGKVCSNCTFKNSFSLTSCEICGNGLNTIPQLDAQLVDNLISSLKKKNNYKKIEDNYLEAHTLIPESFFDIDMLYFPCSINGINISAFVDTGAQKTIMSKKCAEKCGLSDLIDTRMQGIAKGVGTQKIIGKIWMKDIDIGDISLPCGFTILEDFSIDVIFGLDMMISHGCIIDLKNKCFKIGQESIIIPFVKNDDYEDGDLFT